MTDPIEKFKGWWNEALLSSPLKHKNAICVSTVDLDGCPNARFVDLKAVEEAGFTFCSYYDSAKGREISINSKVALTIWWDHVGYQVRVVGRAVKLSEHEADKHWNGRSAEAQLTTSVSEQSKILKSVEDLQKAVESARLKLGGNIIRRPENWGGYLVVPDKIEFLTFRDDRLHLREQFTRKPQAWVARLLQP